MNPRVKKVAKRLLVIVPIVLIALIVLLAGYNSFTINADERYHASLTKSLQVVSNDFQHQQEMGVEFSCRGAGTAPHIAWSEAPANVKSYAIVATDIDAPAPYLRLFPVVHWVVYNIPTDVHEIARNASNADLQLRNIVVGNNIAGEPQYAPPCPPLGQHQYIFRVYALDVDQIRPATNNKSGVTAAIDGHILGYGELIGLSSAG